MDMLFEIGELEMDDEANATRIMDALREQLVGLIHPDDQRTFWDTARAHRQQRMDLLPITKPITEALSGFPTQQPSDSSPTRTADAMRSGDGSLSRQQRRQLERQADKGSTKAALTLLQGRPDLQKVVVDRAEWIDSQTSTTSHAV